MDKYQEALEILKNRNSKLKINHKIGNRNMANLELEEINKAIINVLLILEEAIDKANKFDKIFEVYDFTAPIDRDTAFNILNSLIDKNKELKQKANKSDEKEIEKKPIRIHPPFGDNVPIKKEPKIYGCPNCENQVYVHHTYCPRCGQKLKWGRK